MDKCARVEQTIQSYIDGEQSASERVIVEKHLNECPKCRAVFDAQRRCTADLFEAFSAEKLSGSMAPYVLEHLPEMIAIQEGQRDLAAVNQRAKHPFVWREYSVRLVPAAVMLVLVFLGYTIVENWPEAVISEGAIGAVTYSQGMTFQIPNATEERVAVHLKDVAAHGDRFETDSDGTLLVTLLGPTEVRLATDTRVRILSERRISVEKGSVYLDVSKGDRMFRVLTPSGNVTVFGTAFEVNVDSETTTVAVREGEVQVETGDLFTQLTPGEEIQFSAKDKTLLSHAVDIDRIAPWSEAIVPDADAMQFFTAKIAPAGGDSLIKADNVFMLSGVGENRIGYVELEWVRPRGSAQSTGYQVYVFSTDNTLLFKGAISSDVLARQTSTRIYNRTSPDARSEFAYVKVVPNYETGQGDAKIAFDIRAGLVQ